MSERTDFDDEIDEAFDELIRDDLSGFLLFTATSDPADVRISQGVDRHDPLNSERGDEDPAIAILALGLLALGARRGVEPRDLGKQVGGAAQQIRETGAKDW